MLQIETLKFLKAAGSVDKFAAVMAESSVLLEYAQKNIFQGDSCEAKLSAQVISSMSLAGYALVV